jgi:hypothetical protein
MLLQSLGFLIIALKNYWTAVIFLYGLVLKKADAHIMILICPRICDWLEQEVDYKTEYTHMGSCSNYVSWIYIRIIVFSDG